MQREELKTQSGTACEAACISRESYEELLRLGKEDRLKMERQSREDIIGFLYELPTYLNPGNVWASREETRIFGKLTEYLQDGKHPYDTQDKILCLTTEYGNAAEENGFRRGFQTAMKLCMEGMRGGVC